MDDNKKNNKEASVAKQNNKKKKPNVFKRFFSWLGKKLKEMWSELKKVTWPTMPKVVKQTGVVLGVILIFLVLVTAVDFGLQALLKLVVSA